MKKRYLTICFRHLKIDWFARRDPQLRETPFVLAAPDHGRMIVTAASKRAKALGAQQGATVADTRAIIPSILVKDDPPDLVEKLLQHLAEWCIRFTPVAAVHLPDTIHLDVSGCAQLWGGEEKYVQTIAQRFNDLHYHVQLAVADTVGTAYALAHFARGNTIAPESLMREYLLPLSSVALRINTAISARLDQLGLYNIGGFIDMPRAALRRRFGNELILQLDKALGTESETIIPVHLPGSYQERLPCIEPISTRTGISIALERTVRSLCERLQKEEKGLRVAVFTCFRIDGHNEMIQVGTNRPSSNAEHLIKLLEEKVESISPGPGIEMFTLNAERIESLPINQYDLWKENAGSESDVAELLDRFAVRLDDQHIYRFLPAAHYWPERSFERSADLTSQPAVSLPLRPRPVHLFAVPQLIQVTAPVPDYPPMNFRYKGKLHRVVKADGPERIESEWWLQEGLHRDYYVAEDETGNRYWLFRLGHYEGGIKEQWFLHGMFG